MKLMIVLISLIALALSPSSSDDVGEPSISKEPKQSLQELFDKNDGSLIESDCIKNKINLSLNGDKIIAKEIFESLIKITAVVCSENNDENMLKEFDMGTNILSNIDDKATIIFCIRRKLNELNGDNEVAIEKCKKVDEEVEKLIGRIKEENEKFKILGIDECVDLDITQFNLRAITLFKSKIDDSESEEAFKNASTNYVENMLILRDKIFNCLMEKIE